jgi:glutamyl-tRNA reductase
MAETLISCALAISDPAERDRIARKLRGQRNRPLMVLSTCQRLETYGRMRPDVGRDFIVQERNEEDAVRALARIACGLESRILGELEVMGQVREAYKEFHRVFGQDDAQLDRLFQRAIALARRARRESGIDANLTGLAALTARRIIDSVPSDAPVTIVGSGSLARGVARYLGKRSSLPVRVSSRCPENALKLALQVGGFSSGLEDLKPMLASAKVVVTATAAPHPLVFNQHLPPTQEPRLVIDLGEPPDCAAEVRERTDITYVGLLDVEAHAETNTREREERAEIARRVIDTASI